MGDSSAEAAAVLEQLEEHEGHVVLLGRVPSVPVQDVGQGLAEGLAAGEGREGAGGEARN